MQHFMGNRRGRSPSRSPPRLQQHQDIELQLVQHEWRNRPTSSSESESNSPPPMRRVYGTRPITPPTPLTPPELRVVGQNPLEQLHRELDEVQNQLNQVVQRINEHQRPAAVQQRQPRSRSSSPRPIEADQNPKPMQFFNLLQREVKFEFVTPTDFNWTAIYERTLTRIISNLKQQISKTLLQTWIKIFIPIIYKRQRLQKHRKLVKTEKHRNNRRIYKIRRKNILNQEGRNRPSHEKGQRRHAKHINNFSELLSINIRRSTLYNSIKHPSIIEIINFHSNIDKIQQ
jgi:hypothetical protein